MEKSRLQMEFDALPSWAREMVVALSGMVGHGFGYERILMGGLSSAGKRGFHLILEEDQMDRWREAFWEMQAFARGLSDGEKSQGDERQNFERERLMVTPSGDSQRS